MVQDQFELIPGCYTRGRGLGLFVRSAATSGLVRFRRSFVSQGSYRTLISVRNHLKGNRYLSYLVSLFDATERGEKTKKNNRDDKRFSSNRSRLSSPVQF